MFHLAFFQRRFCLCCFAALYPLFLFRCFCLGVRLPLQGHFFHFEPLCHLVLLQCRRFVLPRLFRFFLLSCFARRNLPLPFFYLRLGASVLLRCCFRFRLRIAFGRYRFSCFPVQPYFLFCLRRAAFVFPYFLGRYFGLFPFLYFYSV